MQFKAIILAALAATAAAERVPYQLSRKSNNLVALAARDEPGYQPEQTFCGAGDTCAEACGTGFEQCASTDGLSHCFDKANGESCCKDAEGNACEAGYYCAVDVKAETWCCPDGMSPEECAAKFSVTGGLSSQIPEPTSTPSESDSDSGATATTGTGSHPTGGYGGDGYGHGNNGTATVTAGNPTSTVEPPTVSQAAAGGLVASGAFAAVFAVAAAFL